MAAKQRKQGGRDIVDMAAEKIKMDVLLRDVNTAPTGVKSKRTFEFKMCKKVAELTQVVHMLFTRNHEKEVEIEALKDAYEQEISVVISDAKDRLAKLDRELLETRRNASKEASKLKDDIRECVKKSERKQAEEQKAKDDQINQLRSQIEDLQKQLSAANATVQKYEKGVSSESQELLKQIREKDRQLNKLEGLLANKDRNLHDKEHQVKKLTKQLDQTETKLTAELQELKRALVEVTETKDNLSQKNKQLEEDLKLLKKELRKRMQTSADSINSHHPRTPGNPNEEIERLKREIRWYRMELSNREGNFNRVFAENRPVRLDSRAGGYTQFPREKTLVAYDDIVPGSSMGMAGRDGSRLPVLGMDHARRPTNVNVMAYSGGSQRSSPSKDSKR